MAGYLCRPFRTEVIRIAPNPGRCPGLMNRAPLELKALLCRVDKIFSQNQKCFPLPELSNFGSPPAELEDSHVDKRVKEAKTLPTNFVFFNFSIASCRHFHIVSSRSNRPIGTRRTVESGGMRLSVIRLVNVPDHERMFSLPEK
jgi:hypothetical protein